MCSYITTQMWSCSPGFSTTGLMLGEVVLPVLHRSLKQASHQTLNGMTWARHSAKDGEQPEEGFIIAHNCLSSKFANAQGKRKLGGPSNLYSPFGSS